MMIKDEKLYDKLKQLALVGFTALGTLYFALGTIWGLPAVEEVLGTIAAVDTFLGAFLKVSNTKYIEDLETLNEAVLADGTNFDGELLFDVGAVGDRPDLVTILSDEPSVLQQKPTLTFVTRVIDTSPKKPSEGR